MKLELQFLIIILLLFSLSCSEKSVTPPDEERPPGYQEDIPWPSLADTPWPMNNADPQNTGRSEYANNITGIIESVLPARYTRSGISINHDSSFVFLTSDSLKSISFNGELRFAYKIGGQSLVTPLIDSDGKIYTASSIKRELYQFDNKGNLIYTFKLDGSLVAPLLNIDKDGTIYCIDEIKNLYALSPEGYIKWKIHMPGANPYSFGISFSPNGKTIYIPGESSTLIAFDTQDKMILWEYGTVKMSNAPVVDSDGNIYLLPKYEKGDNSQFICLKPDGVIKWAYPFINNGNSLFNSNSPTIDKKGNIYFATDSLFALDFNGSLRWKKGLKGFSDSHLISDINSDIVVGTMGIEGFKISIACFTSEGSMKWEFIESQNQVGGSPAIGFGRIVYPSWRGSKLYIIK